MPRIADSRLESTIIQAALTLLDTEGLHALTIREVSRLAGTTTPTFYERFRDREALVWGVVAWVQADIHRHIAAANTIEAIAEGMLAYFAEHPGRLDLLNQYWPSIATTGRPKPVFEKAMAMLVEQTGCSPEMAEQTNYALTALMLGTSLLMRSAGRENEVWHRLRNSSLRAVGVLYRACAQARAS